MGKTSDPRDAGAGPQRDIAVKLDLAQAYFEMGDHEGAREILKEVLAEGDSEQRRSAESLIRRIPGAEKVVAPTGTDQHGLQPSEVRRFSAVFGHALAYPHQDIVRAALLEARARGHDWETCLKLASSSKLTRAQLEDGLEMFGRFGLVEVITGLLRHENPLIRSSAAEALARLGDMRHLESLSVLASDMDDTVRRKGASAMLRLKANAMHGHAPPPLSIPETPGLAQKALVRLLEDSHDPLALITLTRLCAEPADASAFFDAMVAWPGALPPGLIEFLGQSGDPLAIPALQRQWDIGRNRPEAAFALVRISHDQAAETLANWLGSPDPGACTAARSALASADGRFIEAFVRACAANEELCAEEGYSLVSLGGEAGCALLLRCLHSRLRSVREDAVTALVRLGKEGKGMAALPGLLKLLHEEQSADIRECAVRCLGAIHDRATVTALASSIRTGGRSERLAAIEALAGNPCNEALEALGDALASQQWRVRQAAANALGTRRELTVIPYLARALGDSHPMVKAAAVAALSTLSHRLDEASMRVVAEFATSGDPEIEDCAAALLQRAGLRGSGVFVERLLDEGTLKASPEKRESWVTLRSRLGRGRDVARSHVEPGNGARPLDPNALARVIERLRASRNLNATLADVQGDICKAFDCERVTIYAVSGDGGSITSIVKTGLSSYKNLILPVSDKSIAGYVALNRKLVSVKDPYDERELASFSPPLKFLRDVDARTGYRSKQMLVAPIVSDEHGELLGVVQLLNSRSGLPFPVAAEKGLRELCSELALAFLRLRREAGAEGGNARGEARGEIDSRLAAHGARNERTSEDEIAAATDAEVVKLVNKIIVDAHDEGAREIHIRHFPGREKTRITFVVGEEFKPFIDLPASYRLAVTLRLKLMCNTMNLSERRKSQKGTIHFKEFGPLDIDLDIETLPSEAGANVEDILMRILLRQEPRNEAGLAGSSDKTRTLGKYGWLVANAVISAKDLERAQRSASRKNLDLETVLVDEFQVKLQAIGEALSAHFGVPYEPFKPDRVRPADLLRNISREYCETNHWIPLEDSKDGILVMAVDPEKIRASKMVNNIYPKSKIVYRVTTNREFGSTLDQMFGGDSLADTGDIGGLLGSLDDEGAAPDEEVINASRQAWIDAMRRARTEIPTPISDQVHFTVTAPKTVQAGREFVLDVWAHLGSDREAVLAQAREERPGNPLRSKTKGGIAVERGKILAVHVSVPDFGFEDEDSIQWSGTTGNCTFAVSVPESVASGTHVGTARFAIDGVQISRLHFELEVGAVAGVPGERTLRERRPATAFASYASDDRDEVLARIQGMQKLLPDLDIFLDVVSIRSGENWAKRLEDEIAQRDVFYLFWSSAASRSEWVEAEWRAALRLKGMDGIDPVPLEPPEKAPPPKELQGLHFNEWTLAYRKGAH